MLKVFVREARATVRLLLEICFPSTRSGLRFGNAGAVNVDAAELLEHGRRSMFAREPWWMMLVMGVLHAKIRFQRSWHRSVTLKFVDAVGRSDHGIDAASLLIEFVFGGPCGLGARRHWLSERSIFY